LCGRVDLGNSHRLRYHDHHDYDSCKFDSDYHCDGLHVRHLHYDGRVHDLHNQHAVHRSVS
jgi:hypothetical protein